MASCAGWLLMALVTSVHLVSPSRRPITCTCIYDIHTYWLQCLLRADYTLQLMLTQYTNSEHRQGTACCRELSPVNCMENCHNQFLFCLRSRPTGVTSGCPLGNHTTEVFPDDIIMFNDPQSPYYMGTPLDFNGTRWTVSAQKMYHCNFSFIS